MFQRDEKAWRCLGSFVRLCSFSSESARQICQPRPELPSERTLSKMTPPRAALHRRLGSEVLCRGVPPKDNKGFHEYSFHIIFKSMPGDSVGRAGMRSRRYHASHGRVGYPVG